MSSTRPQRDDARQTGFTFVEVTLVVAMLGVAMAAVAMSFETSTRSLHAEDLIARTMETMQRSAVRIAQIARPCALTTYRVRSVLADVPLRAAAAGEWIEPIDGETRGAIQFRSASGTLSLNAAALTEPRELQLRLDSGESVNGRDDDGDGLVDEGQLVLTYDGASVAMANGIEGCTYTLTGRLLAVELRAAVRRRGGVQRFTVQETIYLRNN